MKKSHLYASLTALSVVAYSYTAFGQNNSTADGNWNAAIWNPSPPANGVATGIVNTVTFQAGDAWTGGAWPNGLLIGYDSWGANWLLAGAGSGVLNVTGGTLVSGYLGLGAGLNGGLETGTLNISGGNVTADQTMLLGWSTAGGSSINVSGGSFTVGASADPANIGHGGPAALTVSGGTATFNRTFGFLNNSTLTVSGNGTLDATVDHNYVSGTVNVNGGTINDVGYFTGATLNVAGGTLNLNRVGGSHFSLTSSTTTTLSSGAINNTGDLYLGFAPGGNGTFNQSGGAFGVTGFFSVGGNGGAGTWNISGGTQSISAALIVDSASVININSGGNLTKAPSIISGGVVNVNTGGIISEGATVTNGGLLKYNGGNGAGVLGKYITLYGGTVDVNGQNIANLTWDSVVSAAPGSKITNSSATAATIANTVAGNTIWLWDAAGGNTTIEAVGDFSIDSYITDILQSTPQGITKTGNGTLTLTFAGNDYRGDTIVSEGTLSIANAVLADAADVRLATGTTLNLTFAATDAIDEFFINDVKQANGTWGSTSSSATHKTSQITGSGILQVGPAGGYSSWASGFSAPVLSDTSSTADPDNDGLINAVEYALGLDPRFSSGSPGVITNSGKTITFTKGAEAKVDPKVTYEIETSISLGVAPTAWAVNVADVTEDTDTISITFPTPGPAKDFARLKVTLAP